MSTRILLTFRNTQLVAMNIFRLAGDLSHVASIIILIYTIETTKSIDGLSLKTQCCYALVFITRYLDLFTRYVSFYNTLMKIAFISTSIYVVYLMAKKYRKDIQEDEDNFPVRYLVGPAFFCSLVFTPGYKFMDITWAFSLWLEAVAILPQLFILQKTGHAKSITTDYIFTLGLYRALYIPNWIYRYFTEARFESISFFSGVLQTLLYSDFFYVYYTKVMQGKRFNLPV